MTFHVADLGNVVPLMRPGDVIAFGGTGAVSDVIKLVTKCPVLHVGVVLDSNQIIQSTSLNGNCGVLISPLVSFISTYFGADVWWLPLSDKLHHTMDKPAFFDFLTKQDHKAYDFSGAIEAGLHSLGIDVSIADKSKFFCGELIVAGLEAAGVQIHERPELVTPADLCAMKLYNGSYCQLKGAPKMIPQYSC